MCKYDCSPLSDRNYHINKQLKWKLYNFHVVLIVIVRMLRNFVIG